MLLAKQGQTLACTGVTLWIWVLLGSWCDAYAQADWKKDWQETLATAHSEGRVVLYLNRGPEWDSVLTEFQKQYPKIRLSLVTGTGSQLNSRILAERRAGKYIADILGGGPGTVFRLHKVGGLDPIKSLLALPEVLDESKFFEGKHRYADPQNRYVFVYVGTGSGLRISYNSKLVNPEEFTSYRDLLNAKWKGKILSRDPRTSSGIMQFMYYNSMLGPQFLKELYGSMDVTLSRDLRQMNDWLALGKFAISVGTRGIKTAKAQGLPVDDFDKRSWKEGVSLSALGGSVSFVNRAPHPNAAKVFINWFLSRDGQTVYQAHSDREDPPNSLRIDIPKDIVPAENRIFEGMRYMDLTKQTDIDLTPIYALFNDILKSR